MSKKVGKVILLAGMKMITSSHVEESRAAKKNWEKFKHSISKMDFVSDSTNLTPVQTQSVIMTTDVLSVEKSTEWASVKRKGQMQLLQKLKLPSPVDCDSIDL